MYELGVSFGLAHEFRVWFNYSTIVCWYSYRCMTWVLHRTLRFVIVVEKLNCKSTGLFLMESLRSILTAVKHIIIAFYHAKLDRQMQVRYIVEGSYNVDDDNLWELWQLVTVVDNCLHVLTLQLMNDYDNLTIHIFWHYDRLFWQIRPKALHSRDDEHYASTLKVAVDIDLAGVIIPYSNCVS